MSKPYRILHEAKLLNPKQNSIQDILISKD